MPKTQLWKRIPYAPKYFVSHLGNVYSDANGGSEGNYMSLTPNKTTGYPTIVLWKDGEKVCSRTVHSLVMEFFGPEKPSDKHIINHIDGNKTNNRIRNLEWVTPLENRLHGAFLEYIDENGSEKTFDKLHKWNYKRIRAA